MRTCCSNLKSTFHALLPTYIGKVEIVGILLLVELFPCIYKSGFKFGRTVKESDYIGQIVHSQHIELVYNSGLAHILLRNNQALELLLTGTDGH